MSEVSVRARAKFAYIERGVTTVAPAASITAPSSRATSLVGKLWNPTADLQRGRDGANVVPRVAMQRAMLLPTDRAVQMCEAAGCVTTTSGEARVGPTLGRVGPSFGDWRG